MWSALQPGSKMRATIEIRNIWPIAVRIFGILGAELGSQPDVDARLAVPTQAREIVAHRVIAVLACVAIDGILHRQAADAFEPGMLQPLLNFGDIRVGERTRIYEVAAYRVADLMQEHRGACHFVVGEAVAQRRIVFDGGKAFASTGSGLFLLSVMHFDSQSGALMPQLPTNAFDYGKQPIELLARRWPHHRVIDSTNVRRARRAHMQAARKYAPWCAIGRIVRLLMGIGRSTARARSRSVRPAPASTRRSGCTEATISPSLSEPSNRSTLPTCGPRS